jgi:hypothetical protein
MRIQSTNPRIGFHIQKTHTHLFLLGFKLSRYVRSVFSFRCFFDIKQMQFAVGRNSNQVYRTLRHDRLIDIAPLLHQPRGGNKLTLSAITDSVIYSH